MSDKIKKSTVNAVNRCRWCGHEGPPCEVAPEERVVGIATHACSDGQACRRRMARRRHGSDR